MPQWLSSRLSVPAACLVAALVPAGASAETRASATMAVSLEVLPTCNVAAGALAFGALEAGRNGGAAQAPITLECTPGTPYTVTLDQGQNGARRMAAAEGAAFLGYEIFQDASRSRVWGDAPLESVGGVAPSSGKVALSAYGRVDEAGARPGRYQDVITVMVAF